MNTNVQTHTDLIWSVQFDKTGVLIGVAVVFLLLIVGVLFVRARKKV